MMNKINKDEIKNLLVLSQKYNASLTLSYIPESSLYSTKELYGLYYSGWYKIEISEYCRLPGCYIKISDNLDEVTDTIYKCLSDSIGKEILQALKNLGFFSLT